MSKMRHSQPQQKATRQQNTSAARFFVSLNPRLSNSIRVKESIASTILEEKIGQLFLNTGASREEEC
jgi:hypothetical protein